MAVPLLVSLLACGGGGGGHSPTANDCQNIAGNWNAVFSNSCQQGGSGPISVVQQGCSFSSSVQGFGNLTGSISGNSATFKVVEGADCSGTVNGSATISGNAVNGTYSGHVACCDPVSGSFTLTR